MKNRSQYVLILIALFLGLILFAGCDIGPSGKPKTDPTPPTGSGTLFGRVVDEAEEAFAGVTVKLFVAEQAEKVVLTRGDGTLVDTVVTEENGTYSFGDLSTEASYLLVFEAEGAKTVKISFNLSDSAYKIIQSTLPPGEGTVEAELHTPVALQDPARSGCEVTLTWSESVNDNFASYDVYRTTKTEIDVEDLTVIDMIDEKETTTTVDELPDSESAYFYRVFEKVDASEGVFVWISSNPVQSPMLYEWSQVGDRTFAGYFLPWQGDFNRASIAVDNDDVVYAAYLARLEEGQLQQRADDLLPEGLLWKFEDGEWKLVGGPFSDIGEFAFVNLAVEDGVCYVAFKRMQSGEGDGKAYLKKFADGEWVLLSDGEVENFSKDEYVDNKKIGLAVHNSVPYVAYKTEDYDVIVRKYENEEWQDVGEPVVNVYSARFSFKIHNGVPYIAVGDYQAVIDSVKQKSPAGQPIPRSTPSNPPGSNKLYKFESGSWTEVSTIPFTEGGVEKVDLAFLGDVPYVSYVDYDALKVIVKKLENGSWLQVGEPVGTELMPSWPINLVNFMDTLSLVFMNDDPENSSRQSAHEFVNVFNLLGLDWVSISMGEFTDSKGEFVEMVSRNNRLYVMYINEINVIWPSGRDPGDSYCEYKIMQYAPGKSVK
jgi:hypothetical protein